MIKVGGLSDHLPILLQIQSPDMKPSTPFKFNPTWLMFEDYRKLVGETWNLLVVTPNVTFMKQLSENLQKIKKVTKPWARAYSENQ